jgi:hypothetical protein
MPVTYAGQRITAAFLSLDSTQADTTTHTVTQASANPLSTSYNTTAGDAANVTYRLTSFGNGTWATSGPQQLNIISYYAGSSVNSGGVAAGTFATSQSFYWRAVFTVIVSTTGSSGSMNCLLDICTGATTAGAADQGQSTLRFTNGTTINTTIANAMQLQADWGSTTGSPTLTAYGTIFERMGG